VSSSAEAAPSDDARAIALVTGAAGGIGRAVAQRLDEAGFRVIAQVRDEASAEKLRACWDGSSRLRTVAHDVRDDAAWGVLFRELAGSGRRLAVLVNNAGIMRPARIGMIRSADVNECFAVNFCPAVTTTQLAAKLMARNGGGSIVNIASAVAETGMAGNGIYAATKAALVAFTRSAALELAASGIRVNAVAPGIVDTAMASLGGTQAMEKWHRSVALGRAADPMEVADVVEFLSGSGSRYVTGALIPVDGGLHHAALR
jgi:3-oxoacyl-[acyl-carrier protein] reductase